MTTVEDVADAIVQLLAANIRLVRCDDSAGKVHVSREWLDRELPKGYDAQVTVGAGASVDRKLGLSARQRLVVGSPKVNVWVPEKAGAAESAQSIRAKIRSEVCRVIRENRTNVPGVAYVDVDSFRDLDKVDVKPVIRRTEFTLKTWHFENIQVTQ